MLFFLKIILTYECIFLHLRSNYCFTLNLYYWRQSLWRLISLIVNFVLPWVLSIWLLRHFCKIYKGKTIKVPIKVKVQKFQSERIIFNSLKESQFHCFLPLFYQVFQQHIYIQLPKNSALFPSVVAVVFVPYHIVTKS